MSYMRASFRRIGHDCGERRSIAEAHVQVASPHVQLSSLGRLMAETLAKKSLLRIGSRGSPLALVQAREVQARLAAACDVAPERIEIAIIRTTGDVIQDRPLVEAG